MTTLKSLVYRVLYLIALLPFPRRARCTVLLYHSISDTDDFFAVSPSTFAAQIEQIRKRADIVPLDAVLRYQAGERFPRDIVALSFDDGYRDFAETAVPVLRAAEAPATVFVMGGEVDRGELANGHPLMSADDIRRIMDSLIAVGSHAMTHRKLPRLARAEAEKEIAGSRDAIERVTGAAPRFLAYPKGSWNPEVAMLAREAGYEAAFTVANRSVRRSDDPYAIPRIQVDSSTTPLAFRAKLTSAADWYQSLWSAGQRMRRLVRVVQ